MVKVVKQETVFRGKLVIQKGELIGNEGKKFSRLRVNRQDAAAVLILNTDTGKFILTRQFRYAIYPRSKDSILEVVAGKIDRGETPLAAAIREAEEEVGYRISPENITPLINCYSTPGYSSERFFIFYATVKSADKVTLGGGVAHENENIEVIELSIDEFKHLLESGLIQDAKTYLAGLLMPAMQSPFTL